MDDKFNDLKKYFAKAPLTPVIVQSAATGSVLMLAYANEEALYNTIRDGSAWFYSRSRQELWHKGDTSGNVIYVSRILADCDNDTLLYLGEPTGPVCHTGHDNCFFNLIWEDDNHDQ